MIEWRSPSRTTLPPLLLLELLMLVSFLLPRRALLCWLKAERKWLSSAVLSGWLRCSLYGRTFRAHMAPNSRYLSSFWLSILVSSASVSHIFALQSLLQDQDVLFGPHEAQFTAIAEANLKGKEDELAQAKVVLTYEKEQRALMKAALNAKVLDAEKARDTAQDENSDLKERLAGKLIFCWSTAFPWFCSFFLFWVVDLLSFTSCSWKRKLVER